MKSLIMFFSLIVCFSLLSCSKANSLPQFKYKKDLAKNISATAGEIQINEEELTNDIKIELYKKELELYEIKFNKLKGLLIEKLIKNDPKSKGLTNDEYLVKYIISKINVSEADLNKFAKEKGLTKEKVTDPRIKEKVVQYIKEMKKKDAIESWLGKKLGKNIVHVNFKKPSPPVFEIDITNSPFYGDQNAKVTLVEFSDFQCPYCSKSAKVVEKLKKKYKNKIKIVFKHFPLSFHNHAKGAALASMCANEQGGKYFWNMHDEFFFNNANLSKEKIIELSKKLGLDEKKFKVCVSENRYLAKVEKDMQDGKEIGVRGTPSIYINGQLFLDTLNYDKFVEFIDQELKL